MGIVAAAGVDDVLALVDGIGVGIGTAVSYSIIIPLAFSVRGLKPG